MTPEQSGAAVDPLARPAPVPSRWFRWLIRFGGLLGVLSAVVVGVEWWFAANRQETLLVLMIVPEGIVALLWLGWVMGLLIVAKRWSWWACLAPAIAMVGFVVIGLGLPFRVSWHFAQDDFEAALPVIIASDGRDVPDVISHYDILFARVFEDRVYFAFPGAWSGDCGMAHLPEGPPAQRDWVGNSFTKIYPYSGDWYRFCAGW